MPQASPAELWKKAFEGGIPLYGAYNLGAYINAPLTREELETYLRACYGDAPQYAGGLSTEEVVDNLHTPIAPDTLPGIFVDVDGTLLYTSKEGADKLNEPLHNLLVEALAGNIPITVFSGGDPEQQTKRLALAQVHPELQRVIPKAKFRGRMLECLVDDTRADVGGFGAQNQMPPSWLTPLQKYLQERS